MKTTSLINPTVMTVDTLTLTQR